MSTPATQAPQPPPTRPTAGMTVNSKFYSEWGAGTVLNVQGERAQVLFTHHPTRKPVVVPCKSLVITRAGQWETAVIAHQNRERASAVRSAPAASGKKRSYSTTTQDEAVRLFLERFPGGFTGEAFLTAERNSRWEAHLAFQAQLGGDKLSELLAKGNVDDVVQHALAAEKQANLLSVFERSRLAKALRADKPYAEGVFSALAEVLAHDVPEEASFARYLEVLQAVPSATEGQRTMTWPVATVLPYLASPARHLFLKPVATQAAAERLRFDLQYEAALNWNTYQRALKLAADLQAALAGHGCRDFVDVQSFMWVMK